MKSSSAPVTKVNRSSKISVEKSSSQLVSLNTAWIFLGISGLSMLLIITTQLLSRQSNLVELLKTQLDAQSMKGTEQPRTQSGPSTPFRAQLSESYILSPDTNNGTPEEVFWVSSRFGVQVENGTQLGAWELDHPTNASFDLSQIESGVLRATIPYLGTTLRLEIRPTRNSPMDDETQKQQALSLDERIETITRDATSNYRIFASIGTQEATQAYPTHTFILEKSSIPDDITSPLRAEALVLFDTVLYGAETAGTMTITQIGSQENVLSPGQMLELTDTIRRSLVL